ncbi:hypothetical protein [Actinoplanes italicus]|uniref:Uncharacterized protein n=1 Tax=Actinoplanes italicus TaxID=113567 RepID=A0A2T0JXN1_9ACTN|nr:hypothetical protein [Actinoplanes italicus]PRX12909.1 hypothetical protein CLV67_12634 [Actinoplanes italicus]
MRTRTTFRIGLAVVAGTVIAGCANGVESPASSPSSASPPPSITTSSSPSPERTTESSPVTPSERPLPTITLTDKPPKEPTDKQPSTGWVAGMVTRGGTGPCYGLIADDGNRYALYSTAGIDLKQGDRVKVQVEATPLRIYCGPGDLMAMTDAETIK